MNAGVVPVYDTHQYHQYNVSFFNNSEQTTHFTPRFFSLPAIEDLNLSYNHLTELPASVVHLSTLQHLNLEGNQLPALPFSLLGLTRLQSLCKYKLLTFLIFSALFSYFTFNFDHTCGKVCLNSLNSLNF